MINYIKTNKNKIFIIIGVLVGVIILLQPSGTIHLEVENDVENGVPLESLNKLSYEDQVSMTLKEKKDSIKFLAETFQIDEDVLTNKLKENYKELGFVENIDDFDKIVINYLFELETSEKTLFNNVRTNGNKDKNYIVRLVKYFSNIYDNVEFTIAAGIANVESGYVSKYMLNKNNIFGGMYNGNLIGYKNIEYGTLQYIKLLSEGYFGKGLTTVEDIGRIYNPMFNESGVKIAKPTWVYNVKLAMENFNDIEDVDTTILNNLKNN